MEKSDYPEETLIYFAGLWAGAFAVNGLVFDKYGDFMFCPSFKDPHPEKIIEDTLNYLKIDGPAVATMWEKETGSNFYQQPVGLAFALMMGNDYMCKKDAKSLKEKLWQDMTESIK